jgi:HK97 family phage major capsid protein
MKMFRNSSRVAALAAIALVGFAAQAAGVDIPALIAHYPNVALGLAGLGMVGEVTLDPTKIKEALDAIRDDVKAVAQKALSEAEKNGGLTTDMKKTVDEMLIKQNELINQLADIEQKQARKSGQPEQRKSFGAQALEGHLEEIKGLLSKRGRVNMPVKAIISALTTDADGSAGDLIVPQRIPGILGLAERRMTVRDLITPGTTTSNALQYVKETGFTNNAATVSETSGATKPQSEIKFDIMTTAVSTIAHWVLATKQILDDVPQLQSYIDGRLRYGLMYVEEAQLLMGAGTGTDLNGIYTQATAYSAPFVISGATMIDTLRLAMLQAELAEYPSTGIVLHPSDWARIELTKTDDGAYLFANPQGTTQARLWGLPVVATQAMTIDKFLVGAFKLGAQVFDREDANVEISTEDSDNFRKNLVTVRAEERLALAVYRPEAFIKGDLGNVA